MALAKQKKVSIKEIREIVSKMTLQQKAEFTSGNGMWETVEYKKLGIPKEWMCDGPHGLRKQANDMHANVNDSIEAVSFPAECAMAASWDRELIYEAAKTLGNEAQANDVQMVLGPGVNMKRSPLCGRNFEYMSEDPCLAGELGASYVNGLQSTGVSACLKHFFANSQETDRLTSSSDMDETTARQIYLPAFETVVKKTKPKSVMAAYNKVNGIHMTEQKKYLTDVLRKEWGFDGMVVSDWGATHNRPGAIEAGCDLTMWQQHETDKDIVKAVKKGTLDEKKLDEACVNILKHIFDTLHTHKNVTADLDRDHEVVRRLFESSVVLLKNSGNILPISKKKKVLLVGDFAKNPRYQGGGSSHVSTSRSVSAVEAMKDMANVSFAQGYGPGPEAKPITDPTFWTTKITEKDYAPDKKLISAAVKAAKNADVCVIFAGLPEALESEGADRSNMKMPDSHNALIEAITRVNQNVVVVLQNGAPVEMPWIGSVKGVLETYLGGEASGEVVRDILFGDVNPSGRLPETFPVRLEDNPSYLYYFGCDDSVKYSEGEFIGYRYYTSKKMPVLFPFGYGLSYTTFKYSDLQINAKGFIGDERSGGITVSVKVTNTGKKAGREVVQLYVGVNKCKLPRPVRELKGFAKTGILKPGESRIVTFELTSRDFAHWNDECKAYVHYTGEYEIQIAKNANEVVLSAPVDIEGAYPRKR